MLTKTLDFLVALNGVSVNLVVTDNVGPCEYIHDTRTIVINKGKRTKKDIVFALLHEYRHALQLSLGLYTEALKYDYSTINSHSEYLTLPWERDANLWALQTGKYYGLLEPEYVPFWARSSC